MNILIVHTAFIGDIALSTPLISKIKNNFPNDDIYYLTTPAGASLLANNPAIKKIIIFDKKGKDKGISGLIKVIKKLRKIKFQKAYILHRYLRSSVIGYFSGAKEKIGYNTASGSFLYTKKIIYRKDLHEIDRLLAFVPDDNKKYTVQIYPGQENIKNIDKIFSENNILNKKIIAIAPGSKWFTKMWPKEYFDELIEKLDILENVKIILIGGAEDKEITLINDGKTIDLRGQTSLLDLAELLKRTDVLITNDSSPIHIGSAFTKPFIIAIFGPTIKEFGFTPSNKKNKILEIENLECRPCGIHGHKKCPLGHFKCMKEIKPELVYKTVLDTLKN